MDSDHLLNQLMQEYYDFNQGEPEEEPANAAQAEGSTGLSPDDEF